MRSPDGEIGPRDGTSRPASPRPRPRPVADPRFTPGFPARTRSAVAPRYAEPEPEPESDPGERDEAREPAPREQPTRSRTATRRAGSAARRRTRTTRALGATVAVLLALCALLLVPEVRTVLRQSFTHLPQQSTAIYFTENPRISGTVIEVPLTVRGVNTGVHSYGVKVWTENAAGKVDSSKTASIGTAHGVTAGVVTLPVGDDDAEVWVSLDGTAQVLHYRIAND